MFGSSTTGLLWGALFSSLLLAGCVTDIRSRRIPNALVLVILLSGISYSFSVHPWSLAAIDSLAGCALGFAIWIGFWLLGMMGAGDVKFFAAAGAWIGPQATWQAALLAAVLGGVLSLVSLARRGQVRNGVERTALAVSAGSLDVLRAGDVGQEGTKRHLPYGVALAGGLLLKAWLPNILM
jgi:prepilin peptidase CpaA